MTRADHPATPSTAARPLRVLLVDDSPADRVLAREVFDDHAGRVNVETCASGERALSYLRRPEVNMPDVVLLDINMPGLSGFEVLAEMKNDPRLCPIPVVMLTTSNNQGDVGQAYTLHASSYLVKATSFQNFVEQVDAFVQFWTRARTTNWPGLLSKD